MRVPGARFVVGALVTASLANAFVSPVRNRHVTMQSLEKTALEAADNVEQCGCEGVIMAGKPTPEAVAMNAREVVGKFSVLNSVGETMPMDDLLKGSRSDVSIVWNRKIDELEEAGVKLVMVSVGTPENCQKLIDHLGVQNGEKYLFVDPENALYDALYLNRGVKETFFSISTPFAFLDRFTKEGGMKDLMEVLGKWNKALFVPPKQEQAFLQGGTFIFEGQRTVFAHYDESTAAHASLDQVINLAYDAVKSKNEVPSRS